MHPQVRQNGSAYPLNRGLGGALRVEEAGEWDSELLMGKHITLYSQISFICP